MLVIITRLIWSNVIIMVKRIFNLFKGKIVCSPLVILQAGIKLELVKKGYVQIEKKSRILGKGLIRASKGIVSIGEHCEIRDCNIQANKGNVKIGMNTFINSNCFIVSCEKIHIGEDCAFGPNVSIFDQDHVIVREGKQPWNDTKTAPVIIGDNCWIGANALILRGTVIGDNCVIAGGTVVKGHIPPHSMVMNNKQLIIKEIQ